MLNPNNCQNGYEQHEEYYSPIVKDYRVQYDYRDTDGELFSCVCKTLEECQARKDKWLENKKGGLK